MRGSYALKTESHNKRLPTDSSAEMLLEAYLKLHFTALSMKPTVFRKSLVQKLGIEPTTYKDDSSKYTLKKDMTLIHINSGSQIKRIWAQGD
ncbi:hypothetical protein MG293_003018 [Ovis ammon polii]|uniref:Uncharacterized protein n=1 Tax=Ovis ammon polii TaxID=230172 RepID=A0AAD4YFX5_OVIAM|nr:hypothetical protein MG293_003018 [Ovis ammon polii]